MKLLQIMKTKIKAEITQKTYVLMSPGVGVVLKHVIFGCAKVASDAEHDHKADVRQDSQLPPFPAIAAVHILHHLKQQRYFELSEYIVRAFTFSWNARLLGN